MNHIKSSTVVRFVFARIVVLMALLGGMTATNIQPAAAAAPRCDENHICIPQPRVSVTTVALERAVKGWDLVLKGRGYTEDTSVTLMINNNAISLTSLDNAFTTTRWHFDGDGLPPAGDGTLVVENGTSLASINVTIISIGCFGESPVDEYGNLCTGSYTIIVRR